MSAAASDARHPSFLVVLDVDSTLIEDEVIELIAARADCLAQVAEITGRAMRGELDFAESLRERVKLLAGIPVQVFEQVQEEIRLTAGVEELIAGLHSEGNKVGVVSGGFHEILDPLAESLGLDFWLANRLASRDGVLTGEVEGPVIDAAAKARALREWSGRLGLELSQTVAIGDGANDLEMMAIAGLSIAFDAKDPVRRAAQIVLDTRDLAQVLPLLGIPAATPAQCPIPRPPSTGMTAPEM